MAKTPFQAAHDHDHHITPTGTYVKTLIALAILMVLTIIAGLHNLSGFWIFSGTIVNQTIALVIAVIKASLVVWIFMGVGHGTTLTKMWAATGFVWFFLLGLILIDYPMRSYETVEGWEGPNSTFGKAGHEFDGSSLPRVVPPASRPQPINPNEVNLRPRQ